MREAAVAGAGAPVVAAAGSFQGPATSQKRKRGKRSSLQ
jgi:hypothetical protein